MQLRRLAVVLTILTVPALADTFAYANWTSVSGHTVNGTVNGVTVTFTSTDLQFAQTGTTATPWNGYVPASTWQSSMVANAPTNDQIIAITGAPSITNTLTFSSSVSNVILDIVSLGQPGLNTQYTFNTPFSILSIGPSTEYGGGTTSLVRSGNTLTGTEGDGAILFAGPLTTITWTGANPEYWNGFTVGVDTSGSVPTTPAPTSLLLMLTGLAGVAALLFAMGRRSSSSLR